MLPPRGPHHSPTTGVTAVIIDAHAHITGPMELYQYFRQLTGGSGPARIAAVEYSDERLEETLAPHLAEIATVGTDLQLVSPRPWAVPTGDRREAIVLQITARLLTVSTLYQQRQLVISRGSISAQDKRWRLLPFGSSRWAMRQHCCVYRLSWFILFRIYHRVWDLP